MKASDWIRKWYERLGFKKKSSQVWFAMSINNEVFNKEYLKQ